MEVDSAPQVEPEEGTSLGTTLGGTSLGMGGAGASKARKNRKKKKKRTGGQANGAPDQAVESNDEEESAGKPNEKKAKKDVGIVNGNAKSTAKPISQAPRPQGKAAIVAKGKINAAKKPPAKPVQRSAKDEDEELSSDDDDNSGSGGDSDSEEDESDEDEGTEDYVKGGYHPVQIGEVYNSRYKIVKKLGWGHFSTVWLVHDTTTPSTHRALKIAKSAKEYTEAAMDEIEMLKKITQHDPKNDRHVVHLLDHFTHRGPNGRHVCMVFETLGCSLLDLIKRTNYRGLPLPIVKRITKQVLIGLDYIHGLQLIHTDLKPENVLLLAEGATAGAAATAATATTASADAGTSKLTKNQRRKRQLRAKDDEPTATAAAPTTTTPATTTTTTTPTAEATATTTGDNNTSGETTTTTTEAAGEAGEAAAATEKMTEAERKMANITRYGLSPEPADYTVKVVDFGNACWTHKHFTDDIQTRQYRSLEAILGAKYSTPVDMWSMACIVFELATGDLLFEPRSGKHFDKSDDHLAQFMETLGTIPKAIAMRGSYARRYFNGTGRLKHINKLRFWPLEEVLKEKYHFPPEEAAAFSAFLRPMLDYDPNRRATARQALQHPWLRDVV